MQQIENHVVLEKYNTPCSVLKPQQMNSCDVCQTQYPWYCADNMVDSYSSCQRITMSLLLGCKMVDHIGGDLKRKITCAVLKPWKVEIPSVWGTQYPLYCVNSIGGGNLQCLGHTVFFVLC